jgi:hypothetical protein
MDDCKCTFGLGKKEVDWSVATEQKIEERRGKLSEDRKKTLTAIGVEWLHPS